MILSFEFCYVSPSLTILGLPYPHAAYPSFIFSPPKYLKVVHLHPPSSPTFIEVELFAALKSKQPIFFVCLTVSLGADGTVKLSAEGVYNFLFNLSEMARVSDCKASNPADSFERLIPGNEQSSLQLVTVSALKAAYCFTEVDISRLKDFVLNEPERLKEAPEGEVALLLRVAASFGLTGAVRCLLDRHPSAEALGKAVWSASECGRAGNGKDEGVVEVLLEAGADPNFFDVSVYF